MSLRRSINGCLIVADICSMLSRVNLHVKFLINIDGNVVAHTELKWTERTCKTQTPKEGILPQTDEPDGNKI